MEGGLPYWGPRKICEIRLCYGHLSIGAPLVGNVEGCSFLKAFEIKRYIKRDVKCPVSGYLHRGPVGERGGDSLAGNF